MGGFPLVAQADGVANLALHDPGFGPGGFKLFDSAFNIFKGVAHGSADSPANDEAEREFIRHMFALPGCAAGDSIREPPDHFRERHGHDLGGGKTGFRRQALGQVFQGRGVTVRLR